MSLVTIAAPGDVVGAISSVANAVASACHAVEALASDQSPEGRQAVANINAILAPLVLLFKTLDRALGIKLTAAVVVHDAPDAPDPLAPVHQS